MSIYLSKKFQSNIPIFTKDIEPFVLRTGRTYVRTAVILYAPQPHPLEIAGA